MVIASGTTVAPAVIAAAAALLGVALSQATTMLLETRRNREDERRRQDETARADQARIQQAQAQAYVNFLQACRAAHTALHFRPEGLDEQMAARLVDATVETYAEVELVGEVETVSAASDMVTALMTHRAHASMRMPTGEWPPDGFPDALGQFLISARASLGLAGSVNWTTRFTPGISSHD